MWTDFECQVLPQGSPPVGAGQASVAAPASSGTVGVGGPDGWAPAGGLETSADLDRLREIFEKAEAAYTAAGLKRSEKKDVRLAVESTALAPWWVAMLACCAPIH